MDPQSIVCRDGWPVAADGRLGRGRGYKPIALLAGMLPALDEICRSQVEEDGRFGVSEEAEGIGCRLTLSESLA